MAVSVLPEEIYWRIIQILAAEKQNNTLATLLRTHSSFYHFVTTGLYNRVDLATDKSRRFFAGLILPNNEWCSPTALSIKATEKDGLWPDHPLPLPRPIAAPEDAYVPSTESHRRKLYALGQVRELHLHSLPDHTFSLTLKCLVQTLLHSPRASLLFPRLENIVIGPMAVWQLIDWHSAHSTRTRGVHHPITDVLAHGFQPRIVICQLPDMYKHRSDWINRRAGPRHLTVPADAERRRVLMWGWDRMVRYGLDATVGGVMRGWRPGVVTLSGVLYARPVSISGAKNRVIFGDCHCVRRARRNVRGMAQDGSRVEDTEGPVGARPDRICPDHVTADERVKGILKMLEKAVLYGSDREKEGESSLRVQLLGVGVSDNVEETKRIVQSVLEGVRNRRFGPSIMLQFGVDADGIKRTIGDDARVEIKPYSGALRHGHVA